MVFVSSPMGREKILECASRNDNKVLKKIVNLGCILKFEGFYRYSRCRSVALNVPTDQESRCLCNNKVYYCITGALAFF